MNVFVKSYKDIEINRKEILRYAHCPTDCEFPLIDECINEINGKFRYKVCYAFFDISFDGDIIDLGFCRTQSKDLIKNLTGCSQIILFAATVGFEIDRIIEKYKKTEPSRALIFQSIGAERVESLCERFNEEMKEKYKLKSRFSPGYGDLPVEMQSDIFKYLDCYKNICVSLNDNFLMSPSKSVTAIMGIID